MKADKAKQTTIEIIRIILSVNNGYTDFEIKANNLAEECEGSELFTEIEQLLLTK